MIMVSISSSFVSTEVMTQSVDKLDYTSLDVWYRRTDDRYQEGTEIYRKRIKKENLSY